MIYELRTYRVTPGKMEAVLKRFETVTLPIWERLGIRQAGFWTTYIGESNRILYYFLKWESLGEREQKWKTFQADQEWIAKRNESEKDGPLVAYASNYIVEPTSFSAVK